MVTKRAFGAALIAAGLLALASCCDRENPECPNVAPTASFTVTPSAGTPGTLFLADGSGSSDAEDSSSALQVRWDWESDGTWDMDWSAVKTASHRYTDVGTKTITLSVKDRAGATDSTSQTVSVSGSNMPAASFTVSPDTGTTGTLFHFDASECSDAEGSSSALLVRWDWESDGTWDTGWSAEKTASHYYTEVGVKTVTLSAKDGEGAQDDTSRTVTVSGLNVPPIASFTVTPGTGPPWTVFHFDASACTDAEDACSLLVVRWDWEGDGTWDTDGSTTKITLHQYAIAGPKTAKLMVCDRRAATGDASRTVEVTNGNAPPLASFTVTPIWGPTGTVFHFDANGSHNRQGEGSELDALVEVRWDWEDDGAWDTDWSTTKILSHQYSTEGAKTIRLLVKSSLGTIDDTTRTIHVTDNNAPPTASFTVTPPSGPSLIVFHFDASASSDVEDEQSSLLVRWDWENDGTWDTNWSAVKTADHAYSTNGNKTVRLLVKDTAGLTDDTTGTVIMPGYNTPPIAAFTVEPDTGGIETVFQFDASTSSDYQDPESLLVVRWDWESDNSWDCAWTTTKTAAHQFDSLGAKPVRLQVKDTENLKGETTRSVWVLAPNNLPTAAFTITPLTGNAHTQFHFDASASSDPDDPSSALQVRWDWQDDGIWDRAWTTQKTTSVGYGQNLGTKTVRLQVKDTRGGTADTTSTLEVTTYNAAPIAAFTVSPVTGSQDTIFRFDASASSDSDDVASNLQVRWDWEGDGTWDTNWTSQKRASHKFTTPGTKTVKLQVKDSWEVTAETSRTLIVAANPVASFVIDPLAGSVETLFQFDASASSDAEDPASALVVRWDWEGDGTWDTDWSTARTASHQYAWTGVKTIKLAVKDTNGGVGYALGSLTVTSHDYPDGTPTSRDELVEGINGLGFGILKELVREFPDSNAVASPLSISLALGMTVNGARGTTRDEMLSVLGLAGHSVPGADEVYRELTELLTSLDPEVRFEVANSAWCQSGATFKQPFLDACRTYFNAEVRDVDFAGDPYGSPDSINAWVNDRTHGKIPEIVPTPGDPLTRLMLVDAIYFLGRWRKEFDPTYTRDGWFTLPNGSRQLCKMMKRPGPDPEPGQINLDDFEYYSEYSPYPNYDGFQMVDLAYGDSIFSMSIVLPYGRTTIDELISQLNTTQWNEWIADLDHCHGILTMPRFELRFAQDLKPALMALGMVTPFVPGTADFSGIADFALWISRVLHATYIKVNEAGTEAAAVTVVDITTGNPTDCEEFHMDVNRPFLFVIRENRANTVLFMGKVAHPN